MTPTPAAKRNAIAIADALIAASQPNDSRRTHRRTRPGGDADRAAGEAQHHRLDEELDQNHAPRRAERFADADLARALGDRHEHDVHDADAADEQRHGRDAGEQIVNVAVVSPSDVRKSDWLRMLKSSGSPARRRCERRSADSISAIASGIDVFRDDAHPDVVDAIVAEDAGTGRC